MKLLTALSLLALILSCSACQNLFQEEQEPMERENELDKDDLKDVNQPLP